jgi:hypothetical protein
MNLILIAVISLGAIAPLFFMWLPRNLPCMKIRGLPR